MKVTMMPILKRDGRTRITLPKEVLEGLTQEAQRTKTYLCRWISEGDHRAYARDSSENSGGFLPSDCLRRSG